MNERSLHWPHPASQTPECLLLVDANCCSEPADSNAEDRSSMMYSRCAVNDDSRPSIISSGCEQASDNDGYRTAAPASRPDSVATGRDISTPPESDAENGYHYRPAGVSYRPPTSQPGPPQPLCYRPNVTDESLS